MAMTTELIGKQKMQHILTIVVEEIIHACIRNLK